MQRLYQGRYALRRRNDLFADFKESPDQFCVSCRRTFYRGDVIAPSRSGDKTSMTQ